MALLKQATTSYMQHGAWFSGQNYWSESLLLAQRNSITATIKSSLHHLLWPRDRRQASTRRRSTIILKNVWHCWKSTRTSFHGLGLHRVKRQDTFQLHQAGHLDPLQVGRLDTPQVGHLDTVQVDHLDTPRQEVGHLDTLQEVHMAKLQVVHLDTRQVHPLPGRDRPLLARPRNQATFVLLRNSPMLSPTPVRRMFRQARQARLGHHSLGPVGAIPQVRMCRQGHHNLGLLGLILCPIQARTLCLTQVLTLRPPLVLYPYTVSMKNMSLKARSCGLTWR